MDKQQEAIQRIKDGENIFLTGPGGVGKSWVINQVNSPNTVLAAPTGIAALNIGGTTCHKAFGLPIGLPSPSDSKKVSQKMRQVFGVGSNINRIIIDEVGMLRADYLDLIDSKLKHIRRNDKPFGGIQMVVVGDGFQLEPIVQYKEKEIFYQNHTSPFFFDAQCWDFPMLELEKVYRQEDERQVRILNSIRKKDKYYQVALQRILDECKSYDEGEDVLHLCCYKSDASLINKNHYNKLQAKEQKYYAHTTGYDKWNDAPVDLDLSLKEGSKVLLCANDIDGQYVNGDRGTVLEVYRNKVVVELDNGNVVQVHPFTWEKYDYKQYGRNVEKEVVATMRQIPIRLGWAISIHKSQGMTLDEAAIDIGKGCFAHGQAYMALSRVRDIRKLSLVKPIHPNNIIVRQEVIDYYDSQH